MPAGRFAVPGWFTVMGHAGVISGDSEFKFRDDRQSSAAFTGERLTVDRLVEEIWRAGFDSRDYTAVFLGQCGAGSVASYVSARLNAAVVASAGKVFTSPNNKNVSITYTAYESETAEGLPAGARVPFNTYSPDGKVKSSYSGITMKADGSVVARQAAPETGTHIIKTEKLMRSIAAFACLFALMPLSVNSQPMSTEMRDTEVGFICSEEVGRVALDRDIGREDMSRALEGDSKVARSIVSRLLKKGGDGALPGRSCQLLFWTEISAQAGDLNSAYELASFGGKDGYWCHRSKFWATFLKPRVDKFRLNATVDADPKLVERSLTGRRLQIEATLAKQCRSAGKG